MIEKTAARKSTFVFLMLVLAGIFLANLGGWDLWNPDEPRYAQIAREMMETGRYIVPRLNAEPYPDKPPLFFWLIALASKPFGDVTAFSARLPVALAALGVILFTYLLGKRLFDPLTALLAALILFTSEQFFTVSISAHFDTILALGTTAALFFFYAGYMRTTGGRAYYLLSYLCTGFALLTKGPVGLCIPLIAILSFLLINKDFQKVKNIELGKGMLIAVAVPALWLVPACLLGGDAYMQNILFKQTFGRVIESYSHQGPFYYYLLEFPLDFFPWSLFVPSACIYFWHNRSRHLRILFPLVWFAGTFLFFSLVSGKRSLYLLPLYPAAALLMARFWSGIISGATQPRTAARLVTAPYRMLCWLLTAAGVVGTGLFALRAKFVEPVRDFQEVFYPLIALLFLGGVVGLGLVKRQSRPIFFPCHIAAVTAGVFFLIVTIIFPAANTIKSGRFFCQRIRKIVGPRDRLVASFEPSLFLYFLHRYPIPMLLDEAALAREVLAPQKTYFLVKEKKYKTAGPDMKEKVIVLDREQIGHREYFLLTNQPGASPEPGPTAPP